MGALLGEQKAWAAALSISHATERIGVRVALRKTPSLRDLLFDCPHVDRFVRGNHWHVCAPLPPNCLVVSIGIGGEWKFEDQLARRGCEVHAFDPTTELREKHENHAAAHANVHFHFEGLGAGGARSGRRADFSTRNYGNVSGSRTHGLDELLRTARRGNASRPVTYLKIDCEGCEWDAWPDVATRTPALLDGVEHLLSELHLTPSWGLKPDGEQYTTMMRHLTSVHGFRVYHSYTGFGWSWVDCGLPERLGFGWLPRHCMVNAHFISPHSRRASGAQARR